MKEDTAINFLLYSYFELTLESKEDEIIKAAIRRAYRDASSRVLIYPEDVEPNERYNRYDKAEEYIEKSIREIKNDEKNYDYWFYNTCDKLKNKMNDGEDYFKFGHAQKWINMTMKYLYVIKSIFIKYGVYVDIFQTLLSDELEKKLHVPIDSYILESISAKGSEVTVKGEKVKLKRNLEQTTLEIPQKTKENEIKLGTYSNSKCWSKWEKEDYEAVITNNERGQKSLNEVLNGILDGNSADQTPLDWEGAAWIEIAKIRKEREGKKNKNEM